HQGFADPIRTRDDGGEPPDDVRLREERRLTRRRQPDLRREIRLADAVEDDTADKDGVGRQRASARRPVAEVTGDTRDVGEARADRVTSEVESRSAVASR